MSNELPRISALLPSRNGERYLNQLVPCILGMLGTDDELVVINDGSTDNSALLLANLVESNSKLRIITTDGIGLVAALNLGISHAKNPWIARFDVDDEYQPDRISLQRRLIENDVAVIFCDYRFMSFTGVWFGTVPTAIISNPTKLSLVTSQRTPHPAALMNRSMVLDAGGYKAEEFPAEDLGLWFRMTEKGKFLSVPKSLLCYRLSNGSISASNRKQQLKKKNQLISDFRSWPFFIENCIQDFPNTVSIYLRLNNSTARIIFHLRDIFKAAKLSEYKVSSTQLASVIPFFTLFKIPFVLIDVFMKTTIRRVYRLMKNFL